MVRSFKIFYISTFNSKVFQLCSGLNFWCKAQFDLVQVEVNISSKCYTKILFHLATVTRHNFSLFPKYSYKPQHWLCSVNGNSSFTRLFSLVHVQKKTVTTYISWSSSTVLVTATKIFFKHVFLTAVAACYHKMNTCIVTIRLQPWFIRTPASGWNQNKEPARRHIISTNRHQ